MPPKPRHNEICEEEEKCSPHSSSARTNKFKVTVPVAPKFTCKDRLEKRKEYYNKLEEKHKALEREKHEAEARKKEEEAAAIKRLRKNMMYKANPVPSFYREGPPIKPLTRRRSFGDAGNTCIESIECFSAKVEERIDGQRPVEITKTYNDRQDITGVCFIISLVVL